MQIQRVNSQLPASQNRQTKYKNQPAFGINIVNTSREFFDLAGSNGEVAAGINKAKVKFQHIPDRIIMGGEKAPRLGYDFCKLYFENIDKGVHSKIWMNDANKANIFECFEQIVNPFTHIQEKFASKVQMTSLAESELKKDFGKYVTDISGFDYFLSGASLCKSPTLEAHPDVVPSNIFRKIIHSFVKKQPHLILSANNERYMINSNTNFHGLRDILDKDTKNLAYAKYADQL